MRRLATAFLLFLLITGWCKLAAAELRLAALFSDHMVLQREKPVPVWGWADPGASVTVRFADQRVETQADDAGRWQARLRPMRANAEPQALMVSVADKPEKVRVEDVLVGEVWLGSGQSNMAMTVARSRDFEQERAKADKPRIRMFRETSGAAESPQADAAGGWSVCSSETVGGFSATLYFFGRELHERLNVPVGLINSSVGGTPIESWIAAEAQAGSPELRESHEETLRAYREFDVARAEAQHEQALERWRRQVVAAREAGKPLPRRPFSPVDRHKRRGPPGGLFNGKIAPLIPYALRGAVWYQGEANSHPGKGHFYQYQLPLLVTDWRERWGEDFPFAWVQLPNFRRAGDGWMLVREGMLKSLRLPDTGMAITVDIGEADDIHPKNKQDVGKRLAMWALHDVYGREDVAASGPLPAGHEIQGREVVVQFTHCRGGLQAKGGKPEGFVIAGPDRKWHPAEARIAGETIVVSSPAVERPVAVRYSWAADPDGNIYNGQGLPASPFRTDDWPTGDSANSNEGPVRE